MTEAEREILWARTASARGNPDLTHKQADRRMYEHKAARRNMTNGSGK